MLNHQTRTGSLGSFAQTAFTEVYHYTASDADLGVRELESKGRMQFAVVADVYANALGLDAALPVMATEVTMCCVSHDWECVAFAAPNKRFDWARALRTGTMASP